MEMPSMLLLRRSLGKDDRRTKKRRKDDYFVRVSILGFGDCFSAFAQIKTFTETKLLKRRILM